MSCGERHSAALTSTGLVLTWGSGQHGCLGHGDRVDVSAPKLVSSLLKGSRGGTGNRKGGRARKGQAGPEAALPPVGGLQGAASSSDPSVASSPREPQLQQEYDYSHFECAAPMPHHTTPHRLDVLPIVAH